MKKIIMLVSKIDSPNKNKFVENINKHFQKDTVLELGDIHDVSMYLGKENEISCGDKNIRDYDLVIFRGITAKDRSLASAIAIILDLNGVDYVDKIYGNIGTSENKLVSITKLYSENLPIPETYYTSKKPDEVVYKRIVEKLGTPFVAKDLLKQRGLGVKRISNLEEFLSLENSNIFQKLVDKEHEYRVLVLGNDIGVFEEKIASDPNEFRNNVALGASEVFMNKADASDEIKNISVKSAKTLGLDIAGVDVITEKETGKIYLLEANRGPGMTYSDESPEFKAIAEYLEKDA